MVAQQVVVGGVALRKQRQHLLDDVGVIEKHCQLLVRHRAAAERKDLCDELHEIHQLRLYQVQVGLPFAQIVLLLRKDKGFEVQQPNRSERHQFLLDHCDQCHDFSLYLIARLQLLHVCLGENEQLQKLHPQVAEGCEHLPSADVLHVLSKLIDDLSSQLLPDCIILKEGLQLALQLHKHLVHLHVVYLLLAHFVGHTLKDPVDDLLEHCRGERLQSLVSQGGPNLDEQKGDFHLQLLEDDLT